MSKTKIYLHGEGIPEVKIIEIDESTTIKEIIIEHVKSCAGGTTVDEFEIFIEDAQESCNKEHDCNSAGIHKSQKLHIHRCKHIDVAFVYNGAEKHLRTTPGTTGTKLLAEIAGQFNISPGDANDLKIKLPDGKIMDHDSHIGTFVHHHHHKCGIKLILEEDVKIQG